MTKKYTLESIYKSIRDEKDILDDEEERLSAHSARSNKKRNR